MSKSQLQHGCVVGVKKVSSSAWLEWILDRKVSFSMSGTGLGQNCLFQRYGAKGGLQSNLGSILSEMCLQSV
jgi:hypothetical protein